MIYNIPCRSNPMPYYKDNSSPDYSTMPFTVQTMGTSGTVKLNMLYGTSLGGFYYSKDKGSTWIPYTVGNTIDIAADETVSFSGTNNSFGNGYQNRAYRPSASVPSMIYGQIVSLANGNIGAYFNHFLSHENGANLNIVNMRNLYLPDKTTYTNIDYNGFCWKNDVLTGGNVFRYSGANSCYTYFFNYCSNIKVFEISFTNWVAAAWDSNSFSNANTTNCIVIKPPSLLPTNTYLTNFSNFVNREEDGLYRCNKSTNTSYGNKINQTVLLEQGVIQDE